MCIRGVFRRLRDSHLYAVNKPQVCTVGAPPRTGVQGSGLKDLYPGCICSRQPTPLTHACAYQGLRGDLSCPTTSCLLASREGRSGWKAVLLRGWSSWVPGWAGWCQGPSLVEEGARPAPCAACGQENSRSGRSWLWPPRARGHNACYF